VPPTYTTGGLALHFGVPAWKILHAIHRGYLKEPPRIGAYRVWLAADLAKIRAALVRAGYLEREGVPCG
jgi:hypothetical protein